jgi:hypothetical protein
VYAFARHWLIGVDVAKIVEYRVHGINGEGKRGRNWSIIPFTAATNFSVSVVVEAGPTMIG